MQLALRLPRMPEVDQNKLEKLRGQMHELIFIQSKAPGAGSPQPQALSDAGHLAHAALARASAFVTRDNAILNSRTELLNRFGIDVLSVEELLATFLRDAEDQMLGTRHGSGFVCEPANANTVRKYLLSQNLSPPMIEEFAGKKEHLINPSRLAIWQQDNLAACAVLLESEMPKSITRLLIHVRPEVLNIELYTDHLLDTMLRKASALGAVVVELEHLAGQSTLTTIAKARGFTQQSSASTLAKVVLRRPVTISSWAAAAKELKRRTGLQLPPTMPAGHDAERFPVKITQSNEINVSLTGLENMLGPTLLIREDQQGVIVPITHGYSELLLGASRQMLLDITDDKDATFLSRRAYVNTPKASNVMRPGSPILFYESKKSGGVGSIVAVARIVHVKIWNKEDVPYEDSKRLVVEDVTDFSSSNEVLVTSFENLFVLHDPVSLDWLKAVGAVNGANLITARQVPGTTVTKILDRGWQNGQH